MKTLIYILPDIDAGVASLVRNLLYIKSSRYHMKVILTHKMGIILSDDVTRNCLMQI